MIREPEFAGRFYASDRKSLLVEIQESILSQLGPGKVKQGNASAGIAPHAGYMYSGPCAAHTYSSLAAADTIIILGFSHHGAGRGLCVSKDDWKTPMGICRTDQAAAAKIAALGSANEEVHAHEHSIEVQVPFIQHYFPSARIVAVSVSDDCEFVKCAGEIAKIRASVVATSDFTHFGQAYGYFPFSHDIRQNLEKLDMGAIGFIKSLDSVGFLQYIRQTGATICGRAPIALLIEIMKYRKLKPELLKYYTSSDITNDSSSSVSYASISGSLHNMQD